MNIQSRLVDLLKGGDSIAAAQAIQAARENGSLQAGGLRGASLRGARLDDTDLRDADLAGADLRGASLREANLSGANLEDADMTGADLSSAWLGMANLKGAQAPPEQLVWAEALGGATMPDGSVYDGRYVLEGDVKAAVERGIDPDDAEQMAEFYGVSFVAYQAGQRWLKVNLNRLMARSGD